MHAVAVTRIRGLEGRDGGYREPPRALEDPPREVVARVLAEVTGRDEADWRMRIGQPLPWLIGMEPDATRASALVSELRRHGLGAVTCDAERARPWAPRDHASVLFEESEVAFVEEPRRIAYDAVRVAVFATLDTETSTAESQRVQVLANPRSGAVAMRAVHYRRERSRVRALFLVLGEGEPDVRLVEGSLRLASGPVNGTTAFERFDHAVTAILEKLPSAIPDERLLTARRAQRGFSRRNDGVTHTTSNLRETDLVARLIGVAWMDGQIDPWTQ